MKFYTTLESLLILSDGAILISTTQLASILGISPKTVYNLQSLRRTKQTKPGNSSFPLQPVNVGGKPRYHLRDVAIYLDSLSCIQLHKKRGRPTKASEVENRRFINELSSKI